MNSTPGARTDTATTRSRQLAIFAQDSLGERGERAGREGEKRPSDHNHTLTIIVIKIKKPQRT